MSWEGTAGENLGNKIVNNSSLTAESFVIHHWTGIPIMDREGNSDLFGLLALT